MKSKGKSDYLCSASENINDTCINGPGLFIVMLVGPDPMTYSISVPYLWK